MSGILLLLPFFLIRFGFLSFLGKNAVSRAAYYAPCENHEQTAMRIYQISNAAILICLFFLPIRVSPRWLFLAGAAVFASGTITLAVSAADFASPSESGMNKNGIYRFSRNPMYLAYFLFFMGCALLTQSPLLFGFVCVFQITAHWIILAEERWCIQRFGDEYLKYMDKVRRYL